jgi:hypothetical protein
MTRDQVWLAVKEDKEKVYGKTMLEAFLMAVDELSSRHLLEALAMGHGEVMDQKMITKVLRNSSGTPSYEVLRDKVIEGVEDMSSSLVYNILKNEDDKTIDAIALKMGKRIQKINENDLLNLAYVGSASIGKVASMFGERLKKMSPAGMMKLLKEANGLKSLENTVESLGGWHHVLGRILEGRSPECGIRLWRNLAWTIRNYDAMDLFVGKLLEMKDTHPQVEVFAKYLQGEGKSDYQPDITKQLLGIIGGEYGD